MKTPKRKSTDGKTKASTASLHLPIRQTKTEKPYVERVHHEIKANLRRLQEEVQASPANEEKLKCVIALADVAMQATNILQGLYGSGSMAQRELVRMVALQGEKFVGLYELRLPSALRDKPRAFETRGDEMRRALTKEWQANAKLRATGKTEYDWLRLSIEGFVRAVHNPARARSVDNTAKASPGLDSLLENDGLVAVPQNVSAGLLLPEAKKDAGKWAKAYVDWYESLHPLTFKDAKGNWIVPPNASAVADPIHRIAFQHLRTLQKSNPNEKSPLNALRAKVRERFESAFSEVKVERDSDL
jgi:hypothetical protein